MTRRDYVRVAEILREVTPEARDGLVASFASWFASDNPRFDRARFETACLSNDELSGVVTIKRRRVS